MDTLDRDESNVPLVTGVTSRASSPRHHADLDVLVGGQVVGDERAHVVDRQRLQRDILVGEVLEVDGAVDLGLEDLVDQLGVAEQLDVAADLVDRGVELVVQHDSGAATSRRRPAPAFQQLEPDPERPDGHQVLLAAAPPRWSSRWPTRSKHAGLRLAHIDTAAVALARLGPSTPAIDAVVSIGPDMVVVVATRWGQPIFARALSNLGDRHAEISAEIGDSLAYFAGQPGGGYPQTIAITGAGNLLEIRERLEQQLAVPVGIIDPFAQLGLADGVVHSHPLVPSLGLALRQRHSVADAGRVRSINLLADRSPGGRRALRPLLVGAAALVVLVGAGTLVRGQQQDIATARDERDQIEAQLTSAREQAAEHAASGATGGGASSNAALLALAQPRATSTGPR